jgi:hypothetical protein
LPNAASEAIDGLLVLDEREARPSRFDPSENQTEALGFPKLKQLRKRNGLPSR